MLPINYYKTLRMGKKYQTQNSLSPALACALAYQSESDIVSQALLWGYDKAIFFEVQKGSSVDTQCYVMADQQHAVIVFRGSDNMKDWLANFSAVTDAGPLTKTRAHEGFQDALFPAVIRLTAILDQYNCKDKKLWITGHSLAGALASLYAGMLSENGYNVYGLYTFASPRPGDAAFAEALNDKIEGLHYRVANAGDIVPHLPPEPFFSHSGKRIILKDHKRETTKRSWFQQRVEVLKEFIKNVGNALDVSDNHRLNDDQESYLPRLIEDLQRDVQKLATKEKGLKF
jgi:triacylglycerol lipase